jgi:hypothetical protein
VLWKVVVMGSFRGIGEARVDKLSSLGHTVVGGYGGGPSRMRAGILDWWPMMNDFSICLIDMLIDSWPRWY